ncbi:MAG TPA: GNAT family N-acetyltransferase [Mesorhizobium sp.]|jgi:GNAT superfamily N-acetyltransferase|nr:GNAT family N-acetyltransferase [Mesorhizobium sp.]
MPLHLPAATTIVRRLDTPEAAARLDELAGILLDAVAHGASVNFLAAFSHGEARAFWEGQFPGLAKGDRQLFVADDGRKLLGTTLLFFAHQPNQPHRAEIGKMLVHSSARRQGLGRRLLEAAEAAALAAGRTLVMLDTETGSAGEHLYRACGWREWGRVPGYALTTAGVPAEATFFLKRLG